MIKKQEEYFTLLMHVTYECVEAVQLVYISVSTADPDLFSSSSHPFRSDTSGGPSSPGLLALPGTSRLHDVVWVT